MTLPQAPTIPTPGELVSSLPGADTIDAARRWVGDRHNWVRVGWFVAGVFLIVAGAVVIANRATGGAVVTTARKVIPG